MAMVKIAAINWLSKEALEAEVIVSDGQFSLMCFAHPLKLNIGEEVKSRIHVLDVDKVVRLEKPSFEATKLSEPFDYYIGGILLEKNMGILKLGDILIELGPEPIPGDVEKGDYLSCYCSRLEI